MILQKDLEISTGHRLHLHEGGCSNFHGHNYQVRIKIEFFDNPPGYIEGVGFEIDFGDIKKIINEHFDHRFIMFKDDPLIESLPKEILQQGFRLVPYAPTAENMSLEMLNILSEHMKLKNTRYFNDISIEMNETQNSKVIRD